MATSFKHNKRRNVGLVYEFLVRHMGLCLLENDRDGYSAAVRITKKYFSKGQPLSEERDLFETVKMVRGATILSARRIVMELEKVSRKIERKRNDIKKSNLIKEVNYAFAKKGFWDHRIPEYKLLASVQMIIENSAEDLPIGDSVQKIALEEALVRYMTTVDPPRVRRKDEEKVDNLACAFAVEKFHEIYGAAFNEDQLRLIEQYTKYAITQDVATYVGQLNEEKKRLLTSLKDGAATKEIKDDPVMRQRFGEARFLLNEMDVSKDIETCTEEIMLYQKLSEELNADE